MTIWRYVNVIIIFFALGKYNPEGFEKKVKKAIQNGYEAQSVQSEAYYYYYIFTYPKPINGTKYTRCCTYICCHYMV